MNDQYVMLTGSKNNAGDFLIKDRAKQLLTWLRADRKIIDKDAWKPFDRQALHEVNESRALILMGGPALQKKMRPRVYGLLDNLDEIKVPIITMGIGWYSAKGDWKDTYGYSINKLSFQLLERVERSGYLSSVRDYHTLNVLQHLGFKKFVMTGCPALYSRDYVGSSFSNRLEIKKVGFSLGASIKSSKRMFRQMQDLVLRMRDVLEPATIVVAFHHGIEKSYLQSAGASRSLYIAQQRFSEWLQDVGVAFEDISGSVEKLYKFYAQCDLHVGYRVHAHIFMNSISKPSVLINEDGRGKALAQVLGGVLFDGYDSVNNSLLVKIMHRIGIPYDNFTVNQAVATDLAALMLYELSHGVRLFIPRESIDRHFIVMKHFVDQLP